MITVNGGVFVPGIGSSAVVITEGSTGPADPDTPVRLTQLHWAYYALYMEIDRGLLQVLNQERWLQPASLEDNEDDADYVFSDYIRVMDARARLDSYLSSLGGDELAIWEAISAVQKFDAVVDGVERKLTVLDKLAQRRVEQANEERTRRIQQVLGFLSALALITLTGGLITLLTASPSAPQFGPRYRVILVALALIAAALLTFSFFFRSVRRISRTARRRGARRAARLAELRGEETT
jgi:hypothetical protein